MKLSEKGIRKIQTWHDATALGYTLDLHDLSFESEDFVGGVVCDLSVEDAERVHDYLSEAFEKRVMPCAMYDIWDEVCKNLKVEK